MKSGNTASLLVPLLSLLFAGLALAQEVPQIALNRDSVDLLSGAAFYPTLRHLGPVRERPMLETATTPIESESEEPLRSIFEFVTALFTLPVTNDTNQDVEPAVMAITLGSATYTSKTFIKYLAGGNVQNHFATTTDFNTWTRAALPMPAGYTWSADPLMDENPFTTGIAAGRMYTAGIIYNGSATTTPNGIALWRSDNGGLSWGSSPTILANNTSSSFFLDKPDIVVSWHSGTRGYVYVAYMKINNTNSNAHELYVARSTDGGLSFSAPVLVTTGRVQFPQVIVGTTSGRVYVLWVDFNLSAIRMSFSDNQGATWTAPETATTANIMPPSNPTINGGVRAHSVIMARYNSAGSAVSVVWHERQADSPVGQNLTDVYYVAKTTGGWQPKQRVNAVATNDQFMPALDFDHSGNLIVTYYDRSGDMGNLLYQQAWTQIDRLGNRLASGYVANPFFSNPTLYTNHFIGDYQDIWYWDSLDQYGNRFNSVWVGQPADRGNIYVSGVQ